MSFLPVAERELYVRARQPAMYRQRLILIVLGVLLLLLLLVERGPPADTGRRLFGIFFFLAAIYCFVEGVRLTADCISSEVREGTLGLLFLTRLNVYEVLAGKLVSAGLPSFYGLLALMPVAFVPLLTGGVTGAEAGRSALALLNLLFFSLAVGLVVSCWVRDQIKSFLVALILMAFLSFFPPLLDWMASGPGHWIIGGLSPISAYGAARPAVTLGVDTYWSALLISHALAWFLFWIAGFKLKRWRESDSSKNKLVGAHSGHWSRRGPKESRTRTAEARGLLDARPARWLARFTLGDRTTLWITAVLGITFSVMARVAEPKEESLQIVVAGIVNVVFRLLMAMAAARTFAEARRQGQFELLLSTPVSAQELAASHQKELRRLFRAPAGWWCIVSCLMPLTLFPHVYEDQSFFITFFIIWIFHTMLMFDANAIFAMSLWLGAVSGKAAPTAMRVWFWVAVLPWLVAIVPCGVFLLLMSPIWSHSIFGAAEYQLKKKLATVICDPAGTKYSRAWGFLWEEVAEPAMASPPVPPVPTPSATSPS